MNKKSDRLIKKEEEMCPSNCLLFEISENPILRRTVKRCLLSGGQTSCNGDIRYCERTDTIREYVIQEIEKTKTS
jgi:hypothetical protein